ncbi:hypothetical protein ACWCOV_40460 [Kribbella sp. NPDC002412]
MDKTRVDPGALLIAVLAVGVGPLTEAGAWEAVNTGISAIVLVVVWCYLFPYDGMQPRHLLAFCLVLAFIAAIGLAWPIQWLLDQAGAADPVRWASHSVLAVTLVLSVVARWALRGYVVPSGGSTTDAVEEGGAAPVS